MRAFDVVVVRCRRRIYVSECIIKSNSFIQG